MIERCLSYFEYCFRNVPTSLSVGMLLFLGVGTVLLLSLYGPKKGVRFSLGLLLLEYLFWLVCLALLFRSQFNDRRCILTPFWSYQAIGSGSAQVMVETIANVVAFMPFGLLLSCSSDRMKLWKVVAIGGGFSVMIEVLQFVLKRGYAEFDDVFHNVLGCAIGFGVYALVTWLVPRLRGSQKWIEVIHFNQ